MISIDAFKKRGEGMIEEEMNKNEVKLITNLQTSLIESDDFFPCADNISIPKSLRDVYRRASYLNLTACEYSIFGLNLYPCDKICDFKKTTIDYIYGDEGNINMFKEYNEKR